VSYGAIGNGMIWNTQLIHDPLEMCPIQLWKSIWLSQDEKNGQDECTHIVTLQWNILSTELMFDNICKSQKQSIIFIQDTP
jgi:hypothetical protein